MTDVPDPQPPAPEVAWLIERGQPEKQKPTVWLSSPPDTSAINWTEDANIASRFATRDAAEAFIHERLCHPTRGPSARATEHLWLPQPPAPEGSVDALVEIVMAGLQSGYHAGGHHPNCATREDEGCDCYARGSAAARSALVALAARVREAERERDEARRAMQYYCGRAQDAERERDDLFHAFHKARALLGSGEGQEPT